MAYFRKMCEKSLFSTASFNVRFLTHPENSKLRPFGSFNHFYYKAWLGLLPLNNKKVLCASVSLLINNVYACIGRKF